MQTVDVKDYLRTDVTDNEDRFINRFQFAVMIFYDIKLTSFTVAVVLLVGNDHSSWPLFTIAVVHHKASFTIAVNDIT